MSDNQGTPSKVLQVMVGLLFIIDILLGAEFLGYLLPSSQLTTSDLERQ